MRLNKSTSHAMRLLIECAQAGDGLVKVGELAAKLDITSQNAFKIVHILSKAGLVAAVRGRNGGVRLGRSADMIRIGDIVRAMETTDIELDIDVPRRGAQGRAVSGVNRVLDDALEAFIGVLDKHTLADMAGSAQPARARTLTQAGRARTTPRPRATVRTPGN